MNVNERHSPGMICLGCVVGAPGMGNNSVVKVHYALGSRKR